MCPESNSAQAYSSSYWWSPASAYFLLSANGLNQLSASGYKKPCFALIHFHTIFIPFMFSCEHHPHHYFGPPSHFSLHFNIPPLLKLTAHVFVSLSVNEASMAKISWVISPHYKVVHVSIGIHSIHTQTMHSIQVGMSFNTDVCNCLL